MYRLTREVRFAVNSTPQDPPQPHPTNTYAGYPSLSSLGHFFTIQLTLSGQLDPATNFLQNIKMMDSLVRQKCIPLAERAIREKQNHPTQLLLSMHHELKNPDPGATFDALNLSLSPFLSLSAISSELPMTRLNQKFEFSASHRLFNPNFTDDLNLKTFGKCSNPHGHGHNYELQVTLRGRPNEKGLLIDIPTFEKIVAENVISRFDHKNLNLEVPEFKSSIPTVENIAATIYKILQPKLQTDTSSLASVTVWETAKTWCEYSE
ncbi:MAG TPA: 6-carboxytetrahydropterin synthase [Tepidisphaeraceae bacterium]|jgi:6-pyruvoyltetrahydropterin/6-carboxytetrahydropterin synthase|nr:6-carboxytetrahydropterin synthase [Tepidisphaeraceae bacterium]